MGRCPSTLQLEISKQRHKLGPMKTPCNPSKGRHSYVMLLLNRELWHKGRILQTYKELLHLLNIKQLLKAQHRYISNCNV